MHSGAVNRPGYGASRNTAWRLESTMAAPNHLNVAERDLTEPFSLLPPNELKVERNGQTPSARGLSNGP